MRIATSVAVAAMCLLALSSGAQAVEINPRILERVLPAVEHTPLPRVAAIHFAVVEAERYGTGAPAKERALQELADSATADVYAVRDEENVDAGSFEAWRRCFEKMFKDAANRYRDAAINELLGDSETGYPSWSGDIEAGAVACLNEHFGESQATHDMGTLMGNQLGAWAQEASNTSSAAAVLANWFDNTASDLEDEPADATEIEIGDGPSDGSGGSGGGGDGGSSSGSLLIAAVIIAGVAAALAAFFHSQKRAP